jgi:hypothetical protein
MISRAAFLAGFALQSFDSFFRDDGNHEGCNTPNSVLSSNPASNIADKCMQNSVCLASACMAALSRARPTFRFARESSGMTIKEIQARIIPGMLCSGAFLADKSIADS